MSGEYFDALETRAPAAREAALMDALPRLIAHAQQHSRALANILAGVEAQKVTTREALARLPVTRKSELLQRQEHQPLAHNLWQEQRQQLLQAIAEQAERRLDDLFNQALTLYPPATLCAQLLLPLLDSLQQRWQGQFGAELERVFFHSWLRSKLGARLYHQNRQLGGAPQ